MCNNMIAQSVARLTLVRKVASSSPAACRLTQPSIPLWIGKMSTWQMMVIGRVGAFQIGSLHQLRNQDMATFVLYAPQGVDLRGEWLLLINEKHSERSEPGG